MGLVNLKDTVKLFFHAKGLKCLQVAADKHNFGKCLT